MKPLGRLALAGFLSIALPAPQTWGQDCALPIELPDKPRIEDFADYNDFVVEAMKYKKQKRAQQAHRQRCPETYVVRERPNPDPRVIDGPETLGEALRRTRRLPRVDYSRNQTWYNRSTSRSFSLPSLSGNELSNRSIDTHLQNLSAPTGAATEAEPAARERRRQAYQTLLARRDQQGETAKTDPLSGADVLPLFYASDFNRDRMSGAEAGNEMTSQLYYLLLRREQETDEALEPTNAYSSLSHIASSITVRDQRLTIFMDDSGDPIRYDGLIQVENCLSSCVED